MTPLVYVAVYLGVLVFIIASVVRAGHFARLPRHLRWELYPVPHEAPARAAHGGSYFEQTDWWRHPRRPSLLGQGKAMLPEMLFLRSLWDLNRPLWLRSFPFHFGLYLLTGSMFLIAAFRILQDTDNLGLTEFRLPHDRS